MATLNYAFKEISCKIVYYGCGLCGKTTNLIHVHKTVPGKFRGELVSLATEQDRTLFFDFLPLDLGEVKGFKTKFQLYTVPGQVYYNATRKLVLRGVDGLVFVADSQKDRLQENIESFENLRQNLTEYGYHLSTGKDDEEGIPWILQLNKRDMPQIASKEEICEALAMKNVPTIEAVAVTGVGVKETLKGISTLVIQKLNTGSGALAGGSKPAAAPAAAAPSAQASAEDEYASMTDEEMSDDAPAAPAKAAPPTPAKPPSAVPAKPTPAPPVAAQKTPAPKAEPKPPAAPPPPKEPPKPTMPQINFTQSCGAKWKGMGTGSGTLTLANISGSEGYQLTGVLAFLGMFKSTWSKKLSYRGKESKNVDGQGVELLAFESDAGQDGPSIKIWVQDGSQKVLWGSYLGFGGEIHVVPQGRNFIS